MALRLASFRVLQEEDAAHRTGKLFCIPDPPPTRNEAIASFVQWAQADPKRLAQRPADGFATFLADQVQMHTVILERKMLEMKPIVALLAGSLVLVACSGLNDTQQRAMTGTMIGAGGGAILGAIGGNAGLGAAAGAVAGLAGGLIYDSVKKNEQASYDQGYYAGQHSGY